MQAPSENTVIWTLYTWGSQGQPQDQQDPMWGTHVGPHPPCGLSPGRWCDGITANYFWKAILDQTVSGERKGPQEMMLCSRHCCPRLPDSGCGSGWSVHHPGMWDPRALAQCNDKGYIALRLEWSHKGPAPRTITLYMRGCSSVVGHNVYMAGVRVIKIRCRK